ncbi:putative sulfoacetate transporter SauU [Anaerohalosphaera lusitana]|uniref:Putative sulfoacetate transporter SauU n=1 Tax=Anaerohalosphaera lusitana TaxID=1936003 RepID=A0A1U9NN82_9BACT|nr:MFS transporter [Anaerohalosphaera lusitana]AQT69257.1 putative sulfoacetate transporter SauU [Anaerohalosphaera lusitana]
MNSEIKKSNNFPFAPAKWPFFYGWVIVAATTIGTIASVPGQTIGVGVFTDKLINAIGLSRTQLAQAYMLGTVTSSFLLPYAGTILDKLGSRIMVMVSAAGLGVSLLLLSQIDLLTAQIESFAGLLIITAVGFLLIRFFGQGCLTLTSRVTIGKWFNHRRGLATGISSIFIAYSFNASPAFLNYLVTTFTWQQTYIILGLIIGLGITALGWVFYRDNPEQCGLIMDGKKIDPASISINKKVPETVRSFTRLEALKTFPFWIFAAATSWQALMMTAVSFHITSIGKEVALTRDQTYALFPIIGIVTAIVTILAAWISDKTRLKWFLLITLAAQFVAALGAYNISLPILQNLFIAGYAVSGSIFALLLTITWPRYYGRKHLGAISGLVTSMIVFASAIGPYIFSILRDYSGSYDLVFKLSMVVPLLLIVPGFFVVNPQLKFQDTSN